ncbi:MAG TPA: oligopeptide transporter, OPT family [Candidatus Wallbacteria bacterium]|nr:oligopeptide transporter, OPT family [Candidatus Wallbacteria bacterium]
MSEPIEKFDDGIVDEHKPYVPHTENMAEFTFKAVILGIIFGIIFGVATVYLGLKIGLTVSASIPIAVLSMSVFKKLGGSTILENNIVQTIGSAGESIAAGVVFTVPALALMGFDLSYSTIFILAIIGGTLGVFFMIPLRRYLIVKEHHNLIYPEGTACADVLIAGEKGGNLAKLVFSGLGVGTLYKFMMSIFNMWKDTPEHALKFFKGAVVSGEITPELLGVGYIIGPRISGVMVAGGILSALVLTPLIKIFGEQLTTIIPPAKVAISTMSMDDIWHNYIRYIGGGAVVFGGLITMVKTLPTIWSSFAASFKEMFDKIPHAQKIRTERDIPLYVTLLGSLLLVIILVFTLSMFGSTGGKVVELSLGSRIITAVMIVVFGFFFVTVSSRIVGLIGSSSNPISGMTITTLMLTCLLFVLVGWTGSEYRAVALCVGAVVCIAAANGGATSQDLKTGYLVGATPKWQQIGLILGVITSSIAIGATVLKLNATLQIGSQALPAPKAQLMSLIIDGVLNQTLPWDLILVGFFMGIVMEACGIEALPFAVGAYLPLSASTPIMVGGFINLIAAKLYNIKEAETDTSPGVLYSSGLIAGGAITGIFIALLKGFPYVGPQLLYYLGMGGLGEGGIPIACKNLSDFFDFSAKFQSAAYGDLIAIVCFGLMSLTLLYMSGSKIENGNDNGKKA